MIFVLIHDDSGLVVYPNEHSAVAACEGIDVEQGEYAFWDDSGQSLKAVFSIPNQRGTWSVQSGRYDLKPDPLGASLQSCLERVAYVEQEGQLISVEDIRAYLSVKSD